MKAKTNVKRFKQMEFDGITGHGGKRRGAGRPNLSRRVNHMKRQTVSMKRPLHITLRLFERLPSLRKKDLLKAFNEGIKAARKLGLYVIHFSIQSNHIHIIAEAESNNALSRGMRPLAGRFAKIVRHHAATKGLAKKGSIFAGRYHLRILKTPTEMKNALQYVLLNLSKHQNVIEYIDDFSSGRCFRRWRELLGKRFASLIKFDAEYWSKQNLGDFGEILSSPQSWLAREGWLRAT